MDNTNSKEYWNEYVAYWEHRVEEANNKKEVKDKTSDDTLLEIYYKKMNVRKNDIFLDYGCGSGRLYKSYRREFGSDNNYYGVDISGVCLQHAEKAYDELKIGENIREIDGLHIPFNNGTFDKIICFGVFDACNQEKIIKELLRVLKVGGTLLLTGKNNQYFSDDQAAAIAETNARKKGHPNYFTDVHGFIKQLTGHGVQIQDSYYFLRRGDFSIDKYEKTIPDIFYEWALFLSKQEENLKEYQQFSNIYSRTFEDEIGKR